MPLISVSVQSQDSGGDVAFINAHLITESITESLNHFNGARTTMVLEPLPPSSQGV